MHKSVLYPTLAVGLGVVAAGLRTWQLLSGYDESGLPVTMSPQSALLTIFLFVCAALFLYLIVGLPKTLEDQSSARPAGQLAFCLLAAAGAVLLLGGALDLKSFADGYLEFSSAVYASPKEQSAALRLFLLRNLLTLAVALAAVPAAVALLYRAKRAREGQELEYNAFASLMPPFFCWLWLIEAYRQHTANPIVWDYVLLLLAVVALLASGYFRAGFAFAVGKPRRAVFASLLAIFLGVAALPDTGGANWFILIALLLQALAELHALMSQLFPSYHPRRLAQEDSAPEDPTQQEEDISHE